MKNKQPTINDVARLAGVSKATVSAVLNDTGTVRKSTRERVLAVIESLNYRKSGPDTRGGAQQVRSLGLVIKEIDNPYYGEVVTGARAAAEEAGYTLLVMSSEGAHASERRAVELAQAKGVDGLIITPVLDHTADLSHLFELKRRNLPFVLLEEVLGVQASLVDVDNESASRKAVEFLISQGHASLVHFAGPEYSMHSQERIDGVRRACSASHIIFGDDGVVRAGAHAEDGYRAGLEFFRSRPAAERPTAVTCYNDLVALGLCRSLDELGIRVPDEVSVVGFDDIHLLDYLPLRLTSVRVPKFQMGQVAAQMLIRHIESRETLPPQRLYLDTELVVRDSTRALPGSPAASIVRVGAGTNSGAARMAAR
ncbi:MAG TPA: LacI family DNA-binding transcriptional regulator [Longimicrobium sp.]|jgi:DNA-binding LacI/PurR family transcriptional regulator|uniref:LacI family DNA-binding transcriptional regulator n=1 Tax=Longimicrobium sp. TaxID=2029185 RepID=UPI002EDB1910